MPRCLFINKGLFINQYINENGNECVTGFSSDSMYPFVSTIGYFTQVPSEFEVKAIEDGELLCFPGRISNVCRWDIQLSLPVIRM